MALGDNELLDRALDAAESKLEESVVEEKSPVEESPQVESPQEEKPVVKARDKSGKFQKTAKAHVEEAPEQVSDQVVEDGSQEAQPTEESEPERIEAPTFWPAELKAAVAEAKSADAKKLIQLFSQHDAQREEWARRVTTESGRGKELEKKLTEVYEPYRLKLQQNGVRSIEDATSRLLAWNDLFEQDPKTAIADLMRKNNLLPEDFYGESGAESSQYSNDPRVEEALNEAREAKRLADEQRALIERQKNEAVERELISFKEGIDSQGQKRAPFVDLYEPQISETLRIIQNDYPHVPKHEALNAAYEIVLKHARESLGVQTPQKPVQQVVAQAKKAQAAASSVTGAPRSGTNETRPRLKGKDFNEKLNSAIDNAFDRLGM